MRENNKVTKLKHRKDNFSTYITRLLNSKHPELGIKEDVRLSLNNIIKITVRKIMDGVNSVMLVNGNKTVSERDISSGVKFVFSSARYFYNLCIEKGEEAIRVFEEAQAMKDEKTTQRSIKANLIFPVSRIEDMFMSMAIGYTRKTGCSAIFMTAVVEHIIGDILYQAGLVAKDEGKVRVKLRYIKSAIVNDEIYSILYKDTLLAGGDIDLNEHAKDDDSDDE